MRKRLNVSPGVIIIFIVALWYALIGKDILHSWGEANNRPVEKKVVYDAFICSEGNLARMIAVTLKQNNLKVVKEVDEAKWYENDYTVLKEQGYNVLKLENVFRPLSGKVLQEALTEIDSTVHLEASIYNKKQLTIYEVLQAYKKVREDKVIQPKEETLIILASPNDDINLKPWEVLTSSGRFNFKGLVVNYLKTKTLKVSLVDNNILGVLYVQREESELAPVQVMEQDESQIKINFKGEILQYPLEDTMQNIVGKTGQITLKDGKIIQFEEQKGEIKEAAKEPAIRVLLSNNNKYIQPNVKLKCKGKGIVEVGTSKKKVVAGESWDSDTFEWKGEESKICFIPEDEEGIVVLSLDKASGHPTYKGKIEVTKTDKGYIIINEVALEDYVAGVVASETPTSYHIEALKAQAVAARTYVSVASSKFKKYKADVDDTTCSQVYQNIQADAKAYLAAELTKGIVIQSEGKPISNKFFATSCGYTANFGEVWAGTHFPSTSPEYLVSQKQYVGKTKYAPVTNEQEFENFINLSEGEVDAFDKTSPWFRWHTSFSLEDIQQLVIPSLKTLINQNGRLITYEVEGKKEEMPSIQTLGNIIDIQEGERGEGGNLMSLLIQFKSGTIKVQTEYLIRSLFASNSQVPLNIVRADQTLVKKSTMLPSAFFYLDKTYTKQNKLEKVRIIGGGFGHGVGLSQDGANGMGKRGYTYEQILKHYYTGCELTTIK